MLSAAELQERAKRATNAGRHERALTLVAQARRRTDDPDLLARLDGTAAYAELERGHLSRARELCEHALALTSDPETIGVVRGQRALVLGRCGDVSAALSDFTAAIDQLAERPEFLARSLLNRGALLLRTNQVARAADDFAAAVPAFEAVGLQLQAAKAEHNLGYACMLLGELVRALTHYERARPRLEGLSGVLRAFCDFSHGEAMMMAGLRDEGTQQLLAAVATLGRARAGRSEAEARLVLAGHLLEDDPAEAARQARKAARHFAQMGAGRDELAARAVAMACDLKRGRGAIVQAEELLAALGSKDLREPRELLQLQLMSARLRQGDAGAGAGMRLPRPESLELRLLAVEVGARCDVARHRPTAALGRIAAVLDELQVLRSAMGSLDLATSLSTRSRHLSALGLQVATQVAQRRGDARVAFEWAERSRAHASRLQPLRSAGGTLGQHTRTELAQLRRLMLDNRDPTRQRQLAERIRRATWLTPGFSTPLSIVTPEPLLAALADSGRALLMPIPTSEGLQLLVATDDLHLVPVAGGERLAELAHALVAELDAAASPLSGRLAAAVRGSAESTLAQLDELLIAPVADLLASRSLLVVPTAPLHQLPWNLLPSLTGRTVAVARSATAWVAGRTQSTSVGSIGRVLLVAGPELTEAEPEVAELSHLWARHGVLPDLLAGDRATPARTLSRLEGVDLWHVAAHGRHRVDNPLFSHLRLAGGPLFGYDLDAVPQLPRWVILSACDTGRSVHRGDDPLGLATAMLHAGVRVVIAATGRLDDRDARIVSALVHEQLAAGLAPAAALAAAIAQIREHALVPLVCYEAGGD